MLVDPALAPPVEVPVGVPVWLTLLPFEVTEPDAEEDELDVDEDELDVDEDELDVDFDGLALADVDVDVPAVGLGVVFEAGVEDSQGLADALAFLVPVALVFAVAEAVVGELLVAPPVALAVPVALALAVLVVVLVAVVLPVGLALLLAGLALVLLSAGLLAVAAGLAVGLGDLLASCEGDGVELGGHEVTVVLARLLGRLLGLAPPADELIGLAPDPSVPVVPGVPRAVVNPTAEPICPKACRSGGTASVTPMANTAQAAARADRSSTSRRSRGWRA
jgi:hypothetical protein